ncbi:MAG: helix-turn-helix transcriptional regulator [Oscillospiraceae bacterium]|nr:helix-turn-helix transcriptional regulator [Oscillospiraceae bacterium]
MILYTPLKKTMKEKGITTYTLTQKHKISSNTLYRFRHNLPISTVTLNDLCAILQCRVEDILVYVPDE